MAREFNRVATEYLELDSPPVAAAPFTMACWFNSDNVTNDQVLMFVGDKDVDNEYWLVFLEAAGDDLRFLIQDGGGFFGPTASISYSINTWHHMCAVETDSTDHSIFLDGGNKATVADLLTPAGADRISIGRRGSATPIAYMSGAIAEAAIWNVALSDAEVARLAQGFSPLFIQPQNLVAYWPLIRDDDNDWIGGFDLSAFNTPTIATHPPLVVHPTIGDR